MTNRVPKSLRAYVEARILPRYDSFDAAYRRDHAQTVIRQSLETTAARVRRNLAIPAARIRRMTLQCSPAAPQKSLLPLNSRFSND